MDTMSMLPQAKQQKTVERQKADESEDRISQLPDCLLHRILSFLPTKNAAATSVLSKRWQDTWTWVSNLDFVCLSSSKMKSNFINFVERVLLLHSSNIIRFRLHFNGVLDVSRVNSWISAAIRLQVQELDVSFHNHSLRFLPLCLFTSKMLTVLKVTSKETPSGELKLPSSIFLSSLKTLHLSRVGFRGDLSINKLFSSLPVLEELELHDCSWWKIRNVTISLPSLKRLTLVIFTVLQPWDSCKVKVNAENLTYLNYNCNLSVDLCLESMYLLAEAFINVANLMENPTAADHAVNIFRGLCFTKSLEVTGSALEFLHQLNPTENINLFPTFGGLTTLKVNSKVTGVGSGVLMNILLNAPVLECIVLGEGYGGMGWNKKPFPACFTSSLRTCHLMIFRGRPVEIAFIKFLLKNANVLEKINIHCSKSLCSNPEKLDDRMNRLQMAPRSSESCVLEFLKSIFSYSVHILIAYPNDRGNHFYCQRSWKIHSHQQQRMSRKIHVSDQ